MPPKDDPNNSTIGEGSVFEGKFYINGSLRIDGKFEGEIKTDEELVIGENGKVKTNISAKKVIVAGTVIGNITAEKEVVLLETAKIAGDITTPIMTIQKGVITKGQITITGGQNTDIKKLVENSYGEKVVKEEKQDIRK
ncbi:MAG: polymer-forming cytoskeletal protein [Spirochaetes bacterium]|nr:polymer-forming cytoskeletal protein [Spirochaetota bacterium]